MYSVINDKNKVLCVAILAFSVVLTGCDGGSCTAEAPPASDITLNHADLQRVNPTCLAQAIRVNEASGMATYLKARAIAVNEEVIGCSFRGGR